MLQSDCLEIVKYEIEPRYQDRNAYGSQIRILDNRTGGTLDIFSVGTEKALELRYKSVLQYIGDDIKTNAMITLRGENIFYCDRDIVLKGTIALFNTKLRNPYLENCDIANTCITKAKECGIIYSKLEAIGMETKGKVFISFSEAFDELSFTGTTGMWLDAYLSAEEVKNPVIHRNYISENPITKKK